METSENNGSFRAEVVACSETCRATVCSCAVTTLWPYTGPPLPMPPAFFLRGLAGDGARRPRTLVTRDAHVAPDLAPPHSSHRLLNRLRGTSFVVCCLQHVDYYPIRAKVIVSGDCYHTVPYPLIFLSLSSLVCSSFMQVIFRSDRVLHRVLPCNAERFMLTVWIDSPDVNPPEESTLRISRSQLDDWCVFRVRPHVCKTCTTPKMAACGRYWLDPLSTLRFIRNERGTVEPRLPLFENSDSRISA